MVCSVNVNVEFELYFYICVYPILSTLVFFGQELIELFTGGSQFIATDWLSLFLYTTLCVSIICSMVILYQLHLSIQEKSFKKFARCFLTHYILLIFTYCTFAIKYSRAERTTIYYVSIDIAKYSYFWLFTFQFVAMANFMEVLRKYKGDPPKTRLFGVRVENLFLIQILLGVCTFPYSVYIVVSGFKSPHLDAMYESGRLVTSIGFSIGVIAAMTSPANTYILYKGVKKESLGWIRFHYRLKLTLYVIYSFSCYFHDRMRRLYVPSSRREPFWFKFDFMIVRLLLLFELWALIIYKRLLKRREEYRMFESSKTFIPNLYEGIKWEDLENATKRLIDKAHISEWKISIDEMQKLGEGTYANVFRGRLRSGTFGLKALPVAVKILKQTGPEDGNYTKALISEIKSFLLSKNHSSLVDVYGLTHCKDRPGVVMEYCPHGSLEVYLRNKRNQQNMLNDMKGSCFEESDRWALQIANGLQFLEKMNIVHGDLAARNVLLDSQNNAKIADFGMSIRLYNYQMYAISSSTNVFPWRWMAPESLCDLKFSTQSDIWAYGVTLWEIYSFGLIPWHGYEWTTDFMSIIKQGKLLEKPCHASDEMYKHIMCRCWRVEGKERIEVKEIVSFFLWENRKV